jgi:DNA-binding LytR/AlgR family response regulator
LDNVTPIQTKQLSNCPYIIIDDNQESIQETKGMASRFPSLQFMGFANNYDDGLNLILEYSPKIVFLEIDPEEPESNLSLKLINELYRYLKVLPKFVVTTKGKDLAFEAIKYEVFDYLTKPLELNEFRKAILKFEKTTPYTAQPHTQEVFVPVQKVSIEEPGATNGAHALEEISPVTNEIVLPIIDTHPELLVEPSMEKSFQEEKPLVICVKSYGDYRFINADDICYLQADNNSTDIHLNNGEMITAFKTLKHFETVLHSPFVRIHNSYIVNIDYVSRIHTGNAVCYIKNTTTKLPFSKSYKENVDAILNSITKGNYLEI